LPVSAAWLLGELLEHALGAFVREQDWRAEAR
jgi:hypothetical protein